MKTSWTSPSDVFIETFSVKIYLIPFSRYLSSLLHLGREAFKIGCLQRNRNNFYFVTNDKQKWNVCVQLLYSLCSIGVKKALFYILFPGRSPYAFVCRSFFTFCHTWNVLRLQVHFSMRWKREMIDKFSKLFHNLVPFTAIRSDETRSCAIY